MWKFIILFVTLFLLENTLANDDVFENDGCSNTTLCNNTCPGVDNFTCEWVRETDIIYCGCTFCNYDPNMGQCIGACKSRSLDRCINIVPQPKSNADCGCRSCNTTFEYGYVKCTGECSEDPAWRCLPNIFPTVIPQTFEVKCVCENIYGLVG